MSEKADQRQSETTNRRGDGLPEGWVWTTIGEITRPVEKVRPEENPEAHFTYLDISSINNESHKITEPKVYEGAEAPSRARQLVEVDDVLFSTVRTYLKNIALVPEIYDGEIASTGFSVLRSNAGILPKYLFYCSLTDEFVSELSKLQRGTSYPAVRDDDVRTRLIPLAPLPEQHRIVGAIETQFTRLDAAVAALERARANLARYRSAVLQAACEGRLVPTEAELAREQGRDYEPADELLKRILAERRARWEEERWAYEIERAKKKAAQAERKAAGLPHYIRDLEPEHWQHRTPEEYEPYLPKSDKWKQKYDEPEPPDTDDLPELPEGWVWASMEQVGDIIGGLTKNSKRKSYSLRLPYLRVANVYADELRLDEIKQIGLKESELDRVLLEKKDLLVVEGNGSIDQIGRVAIWDGSIEPCVHQNHLIKIRLALPQMANYVLTWLLSVGGREHIIRVASSTSGLYTLSLSKVSSLAVPLPPLTEQHRIVEEVERRVSVIHALEQSVQANLTRAQRLRQAILKKAFEGRLVDQDPGDEPASALLARIKAQREA